MVAPHQMKRSSSLSGDRGSRIRLLDRHTQLSLMKIVMAILRIRLTKRMENARLMTDAVLFAKAVSGHMMTVPGREEEAEEAG